MAEPGDFSYAKSTYIAQFGAGTAARNVTLQYPADGVLVDDVLMAVFVLLDDASASVATPSGWTLRKYSTNFGTARMYVFTKRKLTGESQTSQVFSVTGSASSLAQLYRFRNVTDQGMIIGANWFRSGSGETVRNRALSVTTVDEYSVVLAISSDRTNSDEPAGFANAIDNGMTLIDTIGSGVSTWNNNSANSLVVAYKEIDTPAASGDTLIPYPNAQASNGYAFHLVLKREGGTVTPAPSTGQIGAHISAAPSHNSLTIGLDKLGGTAVEVKLYSGATLLDTKTATNDGTSGWGNVVFTGLTQNTTYGVKFVVDGVEQTDASLSVKTLPTPGAALNYTMVTGSCQFTGSNHPVWDVIRGLNPRVLAHMGDLHNGDATDVAAWRTAVESSLTASKMKQLLEQTPLIWTWDNHDRVITNPTGTGTGLNLGETDQVTNTEARKLFGSSGWSSSDTFGRTYVIGRVRYIQTDQWTVRDDGDGDPAPRTFLGATQKQWFKDTLAAATEPVIVWLCQWTGQNHANGRWNSFPEETTELENWINQRPGIKRRMVMIGGDSHSLQVTDGTRTPAQGQRFAGIPNYNISGFNRSSDAGQGGAGWLVDVPLRTSAQLEADWGGFSQVDITDDGTTLTFKWTAVRVNAAGVTDVMDTRTLVFDGRPYLVEWNGSTMSLVRMVEKVDATVSRVTLKEKS